MLRPFVFAGTLATLPLALLQPRIAAAKQATAHSHPSQDCASKVQAGRAHVSQNRLDEATLDFTAAEECAPNDPQISLLLGEIYLLRVQPLLDTDSNVALDKQAVDAFAKTLRLRPNDDLALEGLVEAYACLEQSDEEREALLRLLQVTPPSAAIEYALGALDWRRADLFGRHRLAQLNLFPNEYSKVDLQTCRQIASTDVPALTEGIEHMERAARMSPDTTAAFSYLKELYSLRAAFPCRDNAARDADLSMAHSYSLRAPAPSDPMRTLALPQQRSTLMPLPSISSTWVVTMPPPPPPPPPSPSGS